MRFLVKKPVLPFLALLLLVSVSVFSQEQDEQDPEKGRPTKLALAERLRESWDDRVPLLNMFHNIGWNALDSITFNYGTNFATAGLGTWFLIGSGIDWDWRNFSYDHEALANGMYSASIYAGYVIPIAAPFVFYFTGLFGHDKELQVAGLALVQSMALANGVHAILKLSTGRSEPSVINQFHHERNPTSDDFSGEFTWFKMVLLDGWPSGHTLSAFATAATIAQIYSDSLLIKIAAYSVAAFIGLGVSLNVHWASDVLAGALMGYAIGATVGRSFRQFLKPVTRHDRVSFLMTAVPLGVMVRF
jgi:membrane-associated phospholipid phosphatase